MNLSPWRRFCSGLISSALMLGFILIQSPLWKPEVHAQTAQTQPVQTTPEGEAHQAVLPVKQMTLTVGKSAILESPTAIQRVSLANPDLAETVAINPREVLVNGRTPGETSLIVWQQDGRRLAFDLKVQPNTTKLDAVRREIAKELPGQVINVSYDNDTVFLRGTVKNLTSAARAASISATLGKTINLLNVEAPQGEQQVLLKVRFADVDRTAAQDLGWNFFSTGATNSVGGITTGSYSPPTVSPAGALSLSDALNLFIYRHDLNLGATVKALESRSLLQILAEPNVLAIDGKVASFLAGGEFPFPAVSSSGGQTAVSIMFRRFGVSIDFLPRMTARGTIKLQVTPEVSSLDFSNGLQINGFNVPALSTRRVQTEIELEDGQSFAIGGLLDNRTTESLNRIPGLSSIPVLGKLFMSRARTKNHSELLVLVTAEVVRPIPKDQAAPKLDMPGSFISGVRMDAPRTPGVDVTGPVPFNPNVPAIPVEDLIEMNKREKNESTPPSQIQLVPVVPLNNGAPVGPQPQTPAATSVHATPSGAGSTE